MMAQEVIIGEFGRVDFGNALRRVPGETPLLELAQRGVAAILGWSEGHA